MPYAISVAGQWVKAEGGVTIGEVYYPAGVEAMSPEERLERGVREYQPAGAVPKGQRALSSYITETEGGLVERYVLAAIPLDERKATMLAAIDAERDRRQQLDVSYDFGEIAAIDDAGGSAAAGEKALQMRFEPDQRNWLGLQSQALAAVISGQGEMIMPMRAEDNWNIQTSAVQVLGATAALFARNAAILFHGGGLKTQVRTASTGAALDAIDISVGWP